MPTPRPVRPRIDLSTLMARFDRESKCREYLERLRWPNGPLCAKCGGKEFARVQGRESIQRCTGCQTQVSVMAGTVFNDSHLPLQKWFLATFILTQSKKGVSACQIQRMLGIGGYKTAWYLCHRIRSAMVESQRGKLDGTVEMDETYIGGKTHNVMGKSWRRGNAHTKEVVIGIRKRNGELRFFHAQDAKTGTLAKYIRENISEDVSVIVTDELPAYPRALGRLQRKHETVNHSHKEYVRLGTDIHTNTVESAFSLLKRGIVGTWHKISAKHLQSYLDEMEFRFNRRKSETLFQDTLRHMVNAPVLTFEKLTKEKAA
ncbi:MAG: IS1595 family transposase [Candidatus Acidiferrales bacterium]